MVSELVAPLCEAEAGPEGPPASPPAKPGFEKSGWPEAETRQEEGHSFSISFLEAWRLIIRPPRRRYGPKSLGPPHLQVLLPSEHQKRLSRPLERHDLELTSAKGHELKCSHFVSYNSFKRTPCVVFCHGSSSCRVDVFQIMPYLFEAPSGRSYISIAYIADSYDVYNIYIYNYRS